jgi:hypothetical protein
MPADPNMSCQTCKYVNCEQRSAPDSPVDNLCKAYVEGHCCATCIYALGFDSGPTPSGPEDGVLCASPDMIKYLGQKDEGIAIMDWIDNGFTEIFRAEMFEKELGEEGCPGWKSKLDEPKILPEVYNAVYRLFTNVREALYRLNILWDRYPLADENFFAGLVQEEFLQCLPMGELQGEVDRLCDRLRHEAEKHGFDWNKTYNYMKPAEVPVPAVGPAWHGEEIAEPTEPISGSEDWKEV